MKKLLTVFLFLLPVLSVFAQCDNPPTATISGDQMICDNGMESATIHVSLLGTAPFDFVISGSNSAPVMVEDYPESIYMYQTSSAGTFQIASVTDGNGCEGSGSGSATVRYYEPPQLVDVNVICDPTNPINGAPGTYNYYIEVELTGGEPWTYQEITGVPGTWSGHVWTSGMIEESVVTNLIFTDGNHCLEIAVNNLQKICSCPEGAEISVSGPSQICEEGAFTSSGLTVNLNDGGNIVPEWRFKVTDESGNIVQGHDYTTTPYSGSTSLVIPNIGIGKYFVTNVFGTCEGYGDESEVISYLPSPAAEISGGENICDDGLSTTSIQIDVVSGVAPYTVSYAVDGGAPVNLPSQTSPIYFNTNEFGTYTLVHLTDGNGCTAKAADLTGSAVVENASGISAPDVIYVIVNESQSFSVSTNANLIEWSGSTEYLDLSDPFNPVIQAPGFETSFTVTAINPQCNVFKDIIINVVPYSNEIYGPDHLIADSVYTLFTPADFSKIYSWRVSGGLSIVSGQDSNAVRVIYNPDAATSTATPEACVSEFYEDYGIITCKQFNIVSSSNAESFTSVRIYPNPVESDINLEGLTEETSYKIYSSSGTLLKSGVTSGSIFLSDELEKGFYILELNSDNKRERFKILKN